MPKAKLKAERLEGKLTSMIIKERDMGIALIRGHYFPLIPFRLKEDVNKPGKNGIEVELVVIGNPLTKYQGARLYGIRSREFQGADPIYDISRDDKDKLLGLMKNGGITQHELDRAHELLYEKSEILSAIFSSSSKISL